MGWNPIYNKFSRFTPFFSYYFPWFLFISLSPALYQERKCAKYYQAAQFYLLPSRISQTISFRIALLQSQKSPLLNFYKPRLYYENEIYLQKKLSRSHACALAQMSRSPIGVGVGESGEKTHGEGKPLQKSSPFSPHPIWKQKEKGVDKWKKACYNHLNAMTKTSKKRYVSTESCRLMRGADKPFPNTLASVAPKSSKEDA